MRSLLICGLNNYIDNFFFLYKLNFPRSPFANPSTHRSQKPSAKFLSRLVPIPVFPLA